MGADLKGTSPALVVEGDGDGSSHAKPLRQTVQLDQTNKGAIPVALQTLALAPALDGSGTVAAGGTAQTLFGGVTPPNGYLIQNNSDDDLWISDVGPAAIAGASLRLTPRLYPGALFITPPGYKPPSTVSLFGATTGQAFTARYW